MVLMIPNKVTLKSQNVQNMDMEPDNIQPNLNKWDDN